MMGQRGTRPVSAETAASRRAVLVAGGGVILAVATAAGWKGHGPAKGALAPAPGHAAGPRPATDRSSPARQTTRVTSSDAHARPATAGSSRSPVFYLDDGPMTIALTIDDGPSPVYTPQILAILEKYQVTASFSMVGENVGYYPGVARDVAAAGHLIVNHTWDHSDLTAMSASAARTEIARATDAIVAAVGRRPEIFRAPYGAWSRPVLEYCERERLLPLDWSVDPRDWARPGVATIVRNIMKNTRTGSIILEHDGGGDRAQTVAALADVIPRLLDQGYRFRPV